MLCVIQLIKAEAITEKEKSDFVTYYRKAIKLAEEFPNDLEVKVVFVDLDGDGKDEAFATSQGNKYEDGRIWSAFRRIGEEWTRIKGFNNTTKVIRQSGAIYARSGEIFRVVKNDKSIDFLILTEIFNKQAPGGVGALHKIRFALDKEGVLRQEEITDLDRYLAYSGIHHSGLISKMESLTVETFKD